MTIAVLPAMLKPLIEGRLPDWLDARWYVTKEEALELAPQAEIGWFDFFVKADMAAPIAAATNMKWLHSIYAGVDGLPLDNLIQRNVIFTNGAGNNAITIAEYVVMAMLTVAKGYREVVRAQDRHEWLTDSPGKVELHGTLAVIIGYGNIGQLIHKLLVPFGVACSVVRRSRGAGVLGQDDWRESLSEFDWVILSAPGTSETRHMIGPSELATMKPSATLINIGRGSLVDTDALVAALSTKSIAAAFLDVTDPEPLPPEHPLWALDNAHISMHLSGQAYTKMFQRAADRFLENLTRFGAGEPLLHQVDLARGY